MKRKLLQARKMLLVAAALLVGASAWAQTTITYDFTSYGDKGDLTYSSDQMGRANSILHDYATNLPEVSGRFAFQHAGTVSVSSTDGLYVQRTQGDHILIVGLVTGDKVTINYTQGAIMLRGNISSYTGITADWTDYATGTEITLGADTNLQFQAKTSCKISSIVIVTNQEESVTAPLISSEANGNARSVTITSGVSNIMSGVTTYYTTNGEEPSASSTKYTDPFDVNETTTIKAITISNSSSATESSVTEEIIDMDVIDVPTAAITAVDGIKRTITFSCTTEGVTLSYSTNNGDSYTEASSLVISENTSIKVKATKGSRSAESETLSFEAGTEIVLNAPTYTIGAYTDGSYTLTLNTDQTNVLLAPTATISYSVDGNSEVSVASDSTVSVAVGSKLVCKSVATGYANSTDVEIAPTYIDLSTYNTLWSTDFKAVAKQIATTSNTSAKLTLGDELISGYKKITNAGFNENFGVNDVEWQVRNYGSSKEANTGLWPYNVSGTMAIANLPAGAVVVFTASEAVAATSNATKDEFVSIANGNYTFVVGDEGSATFSATRSSYIYSVAVYAHAVPVKIGSTGYTTFASTYALDLNNLPAGVTAYYASTVGSKSVSLTEADGEVKAGTGLILAAETAGTYNIPTAETEGSEISGNLLKGCTTETTLTANANQYVLANNDGTAEFQCLAENGATIPAGKAYLEVPATEVAGARTLSIVIGGETTGIAEVATAGTEDGAVYNLSGQRVSKPAQGLYIVNGKKVIIK